ncbi:EF-hand calcium-binding domain-containing protein 6 [Stylophora pistillata]|uniref:EF-hand calcium-binding domain-containing protein 6 n=1 Tax=Stylophora pistillata TaxID=50429 RepID=A0A2B4RNA8_STYPI|nr:EF-hand calcium-binding domain-containing protein 6 [Stylophora pistillata]
MAKVAVAPAVHSFSDLRPSSRALTITPRPASRKSTGFGALDRPSSGNVSRGRNVAVSSLESKGAASGMFIIRPGRRDSSSSSLGSPKSPDANLSFIEVESRLREKIRVNAAELRQALQTFDAEKTHTVTQSEFKRALDSFCVPLTEDQFEQLIKKIGTNRDGSVSYIEFLEKYHQRGGTPEGLRFLGTLHKFNQTKSPGDALAMDEVENQLRRKMGGQLQSVMKALRLFDYNRDGHIQKHELKRVIENFCFRLTDEQFNKLWCKYDMTRNGHTLEYMDFLKRLGVNAKPKNQTSKTEGKKITSESISLRRTPKTSSHLHHRTQSQVEGQQLVKLAAINSRPKSNQERKQSPPVLTMVELEHKLRKKMCENHGNITRAFVAFDKRGDGFVTLDELKRVLFNFAFPMSNKLFVELMDRCEIRANHKISYEQFIEKFQAPVTKGNGQTIPIKSNHKNQDEHQMDLSHGSSVDLLQRVHFNLFASCSFQCAHPWLMSDHQDHSPKSVSPPAVMAWSTVEDILRTKITDNWKAIASAYLGVDEDRDGSISRDELRLLLEKYCLPVSDDHFELMWSRVDENSNGTVDFQEFLAKLGVDIIGGDIDGLSTRILDESEAKAQFMKQDQSTRLELVEERALNLTGQKTANECMEILKEYISQRSPDFRKTFVKFDGDRDGKISRKEFRLILDSLGLYMTDDQFRILSARLGFHKGKITYMEFLDHFQDRRSFGVGEKAPEYPIHRYNLPMPQEQSMKASVVEAKLRSKLRESFQDLRAAFQKIDYDRNGLITRPEFRRILDSFMFLLSDEEFDKLMSNLGIQKGAKLNYREFLKRFEHVETVEGGHPWLYSNHSFNEAQDLNYLSAEQADVIIRRKAWEHNQDLSKAFLAFDRDGNGIVTKKELRKVLYHFQIPVNKEEFKKLWDKYDTDGNGCVDHHEFLAKLGGEMAPGDMHGPSTQITKQSQQVMESMYRKQQDLHMAATLNQAQAASFLSALEVEQQLRDRFRDGYESLRKAFETVDTNRDGYISKNELQKVLFDFHYFLDDVQLNILLDRCGLSGKNKLSYEKFLGAFQDQRHSGYGRVTLDTPGKVYTPVIFERHDSLSPEAAINILRNKIGENPETIQRAFAAFDREGVGLVTKEDLHQIINAFCFVMSDKQFQALMKKENFGEGGLISYDDFLKSFQKSDAEVSRKWLENLYPSPEKRQRTADNFTKRSRAMTEAEVEKRVREVVVARFYSLAKAFTDEDVHRSGKISASALHEILNQHAFRMTSDQFNHIWLKLPKNSDGTVDYKEFLKIFSTRPDITRTASATPPHSRDRRASSELAVSPVHTPVRIPSPESLTPPLSASEVERNIKDAICRRWQQIQKSFRNMDSGNKGTVDFEQLKDVLLKHDIHLSPSELLSLWRKHSSEEKGGIVYKDFMRHFVLNLKSQEGNSLIRPKLQPSRMPTSPGYTSDRLIELMATIRAPIRRDWKEMRRAFRGLDKSGNGTCSLVDFRQMMRKFKVDLNEEEFFHLFSFYDKNMTGRISYNDFLRAHLE